MANSMRIAIRQPVHKQGCLHFWPSVNIKKKETTNLRNKPEYEVPMVKGCIQIWKTRKTKAQIFNKYYSINQHTAY
jgi:hypothetical protein